MNSETKPVLLVEDNPDDTFLIQHAFHSAKLSNPIQPVSDGEEAMAYLSGEGDYADRKRYPLPALVLLDLKLPRKSGFDVLAWIRQQPGLERLPVVVLTCHNEIPDINDAYDLGANFYLVKSVASSALQDMVRTVARIISDGGRGERGAR